MTVYSSTLCPIRDASAIDQLIAGKMLIRRDMTVENWSDIKSGVYGVRATTIRLRQ